MTATQGRIAKALGLDASTVSKILNQRKGPRFRKATIKKVHRVARELGYDFGKLKHAHRRADARKDSSLPVELTIYNSDGSVFDRGTAIARNVSLSGALLTAMVLPQCALPLKACTIGMRGLDGALEGLEIVGRPVRMKGGEGDFNLALEFLSAERPKAKRLFARG